MKKIFNINLFLIKVSLIILISILLIHCSTTYQNMNSQSVADSLVFGKQLRKLSSSQNQVILKADVLLNKKFKTIIDKKVLPPSGNKHDYLSRAIYYWPESTKENNSWKFIDGKINFKSLTETDHSTYYEMLMGLQQLSLAFKISGNASYAKKSVELIKEWFIDNETKMNPHFNYAQAIPGRTSGTHSGIIDARGIIWAIDAVNLVRSSKFWNDEFEDSFKDWCSELLDWLRTSKFGKREASENNNHGTFYDLQVIKLSTFLGEYDFAKEIIDSVKIKRIERQILPNGTLRAEIERASPHMYSVFNLSAFIGIVELARNYEIDLWNYKNENCGSIKDGVDFLVKNFREDNRKIFKNKVSYKNLMRILPKANALSEGEYKEVIDQILIQNPNIDLTHLYFVN